MNQEGIRCGFFNSVNNDRKYDAEDMGRLFEGVISDGVFSTIEPKFKVEAVPETMDLLVNNGKAWFHERYFEIYNPVTVSIRPTDINPRIDAICICINTNDSVRAGSIEVIEGGTSKPSMPVEDGVYYIPIAWVTIGPNDTVSTDLDIESNVGNATDPVESYRCPYSEPSLDPRRAIYAYEGESSVDPSINDMKIITGSVNDDTFDSQNGSWNINLPEGFTEENTIIFSINFSRSVPYSEYKEISTTELRVTRSSSTVIEDINIPIVNIYNNNIHIRTFNVYGAYLYGFKLVLMKIEEDQNE